MNTVKVVQAQFDDEWAVKYEDAVKGLFRKKYRAEAHARGYALAMTDQLSEESEVVIYTGDGDHERTIEVTPE